MFFNRIVTGVIFISVFAWTGQASAGWVIDEVVKGGDKGDKQQVVLQSNQMKVTMMDSGKPVFVSIIDLNSQTITQVDYSERYFMTAPVKEFVQTMGNMMAGANKEMQEAMKGVPPEQRKMMEDMMRSQMGSGGGKDCREPKTELWKTGQQATIAGYPAVRYDVMADGKLSSELWIAKGITAWNELDSKKLAQFGAEMAKLAGCGQGQQGLPGADPSWKVANEGYPVRTVDKTRGTIEVVKAESRAVPAAEFQAPSGFKRKTLQEMMRR